MSAVSVSESGVRPILAEAAGLARRALTELQPSGVGDHLGVTAEDEFAATHHFASTLPGYRGWQWAVVVAAPPMADHATVSESALLPGPDALVAPDFVPWEQRVRPGDLNPGDLLAPPADDPRLVPGYVLTGDPAVDEVAAEIGLGRPRVLSRLGREEAAERWYTTYGPSAEMARAATSTCGTCGFFLPLAGAMRAGFGVCANAMGADGHVVSVEYGCGAHSDTPVPAGAGSPVYEAYDDAAVELFAAEEFRRPEGDVADVNAADATSAGVSGDTSAADGATAGTATATAVSGSDAATATVSLATADVVAAETVSGTESAADADPTAGVEVPAEAVTDVASAPVVDAPMTEIVESVTGTDTAANVGAPTGRTAEGATNAGTVASVMDPAATDEGAAVRVTDVAGTQDTGVAAGTDSGTAAAGTATDAGVASTGVASSGIGVAETDPDAGAAASTGIGAAPRDVAGTEQAGKASVAPVAAEADLPEAWILPAPEGSASH